MQKFSTRKGWRFSCAVLPPAGVSMLGAMAALGVPLVRMYRTTPVPPTVERQVGRAVRRCLGAWIVQPGQQMVVLGHFSGQQRDGISAFRGADVPGLLRVGSGDDMAYQIGQAEGCGSVAAIEGSDDGKQCGVGLDGQQLAIAQRPVLGAKLNGNWRISPMKASMVLS